MAIAFVQKATEINHESSSATSAAFGAITNTADNALFVLIANFTSGGQSASAPTDTNSNTWNRISTVQNSGSNTVEVWGALNINGGSNTVTVHFGAAAFFSASMVEFSGVATASATDTASVGASTTGTSHASGNTTSAQAGDLVLGIGYDSATGGGTLSVGDGKNQIDNDTSGSDFITSYAIQSAGGAQSITYNTTVSDTMLVGCWTLLAAAGVLPYQQPFPRITGLGVRGFQSPIVGLQSTFLSLTTPPVIAAAAGIAPIVTYAYSSN
jgi:hypothetical protein